MAEPIIRYLLTPHALEQSRRRGLEQAVVAAVVTRPQQRVSLRRSRDVLQSIIEIDRRRYLVRVIVDVDHEPAHVVTVYRTSRISKYWSDEA